MEVANKPGRYKNFTGKIKCKHTECIVLNATFEILETEKFFKRKIYVGLEFYSGIITGGKLASCDIKHGEIKTDVKIFDSVFRDGVFDGYSFSHSYWLGGEWKGREWLSGFDKFGRRRGIAPNKWNDMVIDKTRGVANEEGLYDNFTGTIKWYNSLIEVKDAEFELSKKAGSRIVFHDGSILSGNIRGAIVDYCCFNAGTFHGVDWFGGVFNGGVFNGGNWCNGIWLGGTWKNGYWRGGFDKDGNHHGTYDSPDKWDL